MADTMVTWDNFTGGEAGLDGLSNPKRPDTFSGKNAIVTSAGAVMPRPGLRRLHTPKPIPGISLGVFTVSNVLAAVSRNPSTDTTYLTKFSTDGAFLEQWSIVEATETEADSAVVDVGGVLYMAYGGLLFYVNAGALTKITGYPTTSYMPVPLVYHGVRLLAGQGKVLRYSEADDLLTWPATNFIEFDFNITALARLGDDLIVFTSESTYALTGSIGTTSARLFRLNDRMGADSVNDVVASPDFVFFWAGQSRHPVVLDAGRATPVSHLHGTAAVPQFGDSSPDHHGVGLATGRMGESVAYAVAYPDHQGGYYRRVTLRHNDTWTYHDFALPDLLADVAGEYGTGNCFVFPSGGADGGSVSYYLLNPTIPDLSLTTTDETTHERPGYISDRFRLPGDESYTPLDASFTLPEHWTEAGQEVRVRQVIVDFLSWQTGSLTDNELACELTTFARRGAPGEKAQAASWTGPSSFSEQGEMLPFAARQMETAAAPFTGFWKAGPNTTVAAVAV